MLLVSCNMITRSPRLLAREDQPQLVRVQLVTSQTISCAAAERWRKPSPSSRTFATARLPARWSPTLAAFGAHRLDYALVVGPDERSRKRTPYAPTARAFLLSGHGHIFERNGSSQHCDPPTCEGQIISPALTTPCAHRPTWPAQLSLGAAAALASPLISTCP